MGLVNPFCPVAKEKDSLFFVAESERAKEFVKYIQDSIEGNANFTSIVGDYGQGKSRMLFYLLNKYKNRPDAVMAFVSIKHVIGNTPGDKWDDLLFREILNQIVNDLRDRYRDTRPDVVSIIDRIKQELVPSKEEMDSLNKAIEEQERKGEKQEAANLRSVRDKFLQKESLDPDVFFQVFLPKCIEEFRKKGIDRLFILFDEMDHLYGSEKRRAYLAFVAKFRDPIDGVSVVIGCASRIWLQIRSDYPEFTQVYDPATVGLNIIPRYTYADLRNIVHLTLKNVGQEKNNPIDDWILMTITRYYSNLRDMIKIVQELYQEYLVNPDADLKRKFIDKAMSMIDMQKISKIAEDTSKYLAKDTPRKPADFKVGLEQVLKDLAIDPRYYECSEDDLKRMLGGVLGTTVVAEKAFKTLYDNGILDRTQDGNFQLNADKFSRQVYIGQWEQAYLDKLWEIKDPKTSEVKIDEARKAFVELSALMDIPADYFDSLIETLIEREKIAKREDSYLLKFQKQETLAGSIENTVRSVRREHGKVESYEDYIAILQTLFKNIAQLDHLRKVQSGFDMTIVSFARARSFKIEGNLLFWLPGRNIDSVHLKKNLVEKLHSNDFVYVLWPYEDYSAILPFVEQDALSTGQILEDTKVKDIQISLPELSTETRKRARILVILMKHRIGNTVWRFSLEDYLLARETVLKDVKDSTKAIEEIDELIRNGFTCRNLLQNPELLLTDKLEKLVPIDNKNLKNLDTARWTKAFIKLFRGEKLDYADLDQKDARFVGVYNFLVMDSHRSFPTGLALDDKKCALFKGARLPKFVIHALDELPSDHFVDAKEIAIGCLKYGEGYEVIHSELAKRAGTYVPAILPIFDAMCEVLPDVVIRDSTPDLPRYKKCGGEYSQVALKRNLEFSIPLLEMLLRHKWFDERNASLYQKDIEDVKSTLIPELLDLLEKKKSTVQLLERAEFSYVKNEKLSNADRIKIIENQANIQHNLLLNEFGGLPSLQECCPDYLTYERIMDEISSSLEKAIASGMISISEEKAKQFIDSYLSSNPKKEMILRKYDSIEKAILSCKDDFAKLRHLGQIGSVLDEKALLNLLGKSNDLKTDISIVRRIKQLKQMIQNDMSAVGDFWTELLFDCISEIETTQKRMFEWVDINRRNGIDIKAPVSDPAKLRPLKEELAAVKQAGSLLSIDSGLPPLVAKTLLKYAVEKSQEEALLETIRACLKKWLLEKREEAVKKLLPYNEFAKKHGIKDLRIAHSENRIRQLVLEREGMIERNKFINLKESTNDALEQVMEAEICNLRKDLLRKLPEDLRIFVQEAMKAIDGGRIVRYIAEMYEKNNSNFDQWIKILVELEEVGLIGRRQ